MFAKFTGDNAPEKYMLERLKEFVSFIANEIFLSDHHGLFWVVGEKIRLREEGVMKDVVRGLFKFYQYDFDEVEKFIGDSIE